MEMVVSGKRNTYGLLAMQLQEDLTKAFDILSKYAHHKSEYKDLVVYYTKCNALFNDLAYNFAESKYKTKEEKLLFNSLCEFYKRFVREVTHYCLAGIGSEWVKKYDDLILAWESLAYKTKGITEAEKIEHCWNIYCELTEVLEEYDPDDMVPEHIELIEYILDDWDYTLDMYTDIYNSEG